MNKEKTRNSLAFSEHIEYAIIVAHISDASDDAGSQSVWAETSWQKPFVFPVRASDAL